LSDTTRNWAVKRQILWRFLFPGALILAIAWAVAQVNIDQQRFTGVVRVAFYAITAAGLLLGWRFRRSRMALCLVVLGIADLLLRRSGSQIGPEGHDGLIRSLVGLLLPLNLLAIAWSRDRGLFTWGTLWRVSLVVAQAPACAIACGGARRQACALLQRPFVPVSLPGDGVLSHATLTAFVIALAVLLLKSTRRGDRMDAALFWTLTAGLVGLARATSGASTTLYLAAGGLILVTSSVEESFRMAYHDGLTGLPSRRALDEALLRLGTKYAVAMIDVDRFKSINDRHGHEAGDQVLRMVASRILGMGGRARAFRYGGDEFAVIFPGKGTREAVPVLQRLRRGVASSAFRVRRKRRTGGRPAKSRTSRTGRRNLRVHLSIGVAERTDRHRNPEDVLRAADEALYRAKRAGRNRVACISHRLS
jgi:diguanylate cyclase (GGDEF)-like protein